jgi:hypothetical protein
MNRQEFICAIAYIGKALPAVYPYLHAHPEAGASCSADSAVANGGCSTGGATSSPVALHKNSFMFDIEHKT